MLTPHKQYTVMYSQLTHLGTDMFQTCHFYMKEKYTHMKVKIQNKVGALKKKGTPIRSMQTLSRDW